MYIYICSFFVKASFEFYYNNSSFELSYNKRKISLFLNSPSRKPSRTYRADRTGNDSELHLLHGFRSGIYIYRDLTCVALYYNDDDGRLTAAHPRDSILADYNESHFLDSENGKPLTRYIIFAMIYIYIANTLQYIDITLYTQWRIIYT